jgi:protein-S-isoprenylcysteine O-methyltransferase Ste14
MQRPRVIPPVYLLAAIVVMLALRFGLPLRGLITWPMRWAGLVPMVTGLLLGGWTTVLFAKRKTTIRPGEVSTALVTAGPFRVSRNPIYLGMALLLVGVALLCGSLSPWLVIPLFVWLINRNVIPMEEAMLAEAFGEEYRRYQGRVRRWA